MKSFKTFLLEFDPNRGAPNRAVPIIPHYPTKDELEAGVRQNPNLPGSEKSNLRRISDTLGKKESDRLEAFMAGKRGARWQGRGTETKAEFESQMIAHEAGQKLNTDFLQFPNLISQTPAGQQQTAQEKQEDELRSKRENARYSVRGYERKERRDMPATNIPHVGSAHY